MTTSKFKHITVYCGSNPGKDPAFIEVARVMGKRLAELKISLVYGGGRMGLMGEVAEGFLSVGGEIIGVIPSFLIEKEVAHSGLTQLIETPDMMSRKVKLMEMGDGFIAMPGGIGTYEELFMVLSATQLKIHHKPLGLLNTHGFFDPLIQMLEKTAENGFMPKENMTLLCISDDPTDLLNKMHHWHPIDAIKWTQKEWIKKW